MKIKQKRILCFPSLEKTSVNTNFEVEEQTEGEYGISDTVELKAVEKQKEEESSNDKNGLERTESELASETNKKVKL